MSEKPDQDERERFEENRLAFFRALEGLEAPPSADDTELARLLKLNRGGGLLDSPSGAADLLDLSPNLPSDLNRYQLRELLGRGGMGIVHRAVDQNTGAAVAVKFLRPSLVSDGFRRRFASEVSILERLEHPGFSRLLDSGTFASPLGEVPFLVTELIDGVPLLEWAADTTPAQKLELLLSLCQIMAGAHRQGVVHRDLKPSNILIENADRPRVLDLGLAGLLAPGEGGAMGDESIVMLGTIRYMGPEQLHSGFGVVDVRADVFSLGILGYELLTGAHPFGSPKDLAPRIIAATLIDEPPATDLDPELDQVLRRCLSKEPDERYADAAALGADLGRCRAGTRTKARARRHQRMGRRVLRGLLVGVVVLLGILGAGRLLGPGPGATEEEVVADLMGHLERMEEAIHLGVRTEDSLLGALDEAMEAKRLLARVSGRPYATAVDRYINFRAGEAQLFLGWMNDDYHRFNAAYTRFGAGVYRSYDGHSVAGLDTNLFVVGRIQSLTPGTASGARAMATGEMAGFGDTKNRLWLTLQIREDEIRRWCEHLGFPRRPFDVPQPSPFPFHNLGRAAIDYGRETGDLWLVRMGMFALNHVDADNLWGPAERLGRAVYHESYALGLATMADLKGWSGDLEEILERLDRAQTTRGIDSPFSRAGTRLVRAEILKDWSDRFGKREDLLRDGLENARAAEAFLADNSSARRWAEARVLAVQLELRLEEDEETAARLAAALDEVRKRVDFVGLPLLHARWLLAQAELGRLQPSTGIEWRGKLKQLLSVVSVDSNPSLVLRSRLLLDSPSPDQR